MNGLKIRKAPFFKIAFGLVLLVFHSRAMEGKKLILSEMETADGDTMKVNIMVPYNFINGKPRFYAMQNKLVVIHPESGEKVKWRPEKIKWVKFKLKSKEYILRSVQNTAKLKNVLTRPRSHVLLHTMVNGKASYMIFYEKQIVFSLLNHLIFFSNDVFAKRREFIKLHQTLLEVTDFKMKRKYYQKLLGDFYYDCPELGELIYKINDYAQPKRSVEYYNEHCNSDQ